MQGDAATATQSFSFRRLNRLCSPAEFQRVFSQANRSGDRFYTLLWRANDVSLARIGFAIAKKRISLAVDRNRVRRIARESFRHHRHELGAVDIVLLAQTPATNASNRELLQSLEKHWARIRAHNDNQTDPQ